jgi:hypothetical protein
VTKLNPSGSGLAYSTYLGGSSDDDGVGIAVDAAGDAYITGSTFSANFPTTPGAFQTTYGGGGDAFVTKVPTASRGAPASLMLAPTAQTATVGGQACVTGTVRDASGSPIPNVTVRFSVTVNSSQGTPATGSAATDANGQARFCYSGQLPGTDTVKAFGDSNNNGSQDPGEHGRRQISAISV